MLTMPPADMTPEQIIELVTGQKVNKPAITLGNAASSTSLKKPAEISKPVLKPVDQSTSKEVMREFSVSSLMR